MRPLFIHIPKCGGMTVRHGFRGEVLAASASHHISPEYTKALDARMAADGEHHGHEHARWRDCNPSVRGRAFALVRNPWARVASRYLFAVQSKKLRAGNWRALDWVGTFDEFLETRHRDGALPFYWHRAIRGWYPALDHVTDEAGVIRCDVLRTERLDEDVEAYLGRKPPRRRNVGTIKKPLTDLYDDRTRQIVADWYAADIEAFGFDFDSAATRNLWEGCAA